MRNCGIGVAVAGEAVESFFLLLRGFFPLPPDGNKSVNTFATPGSLGGFLPLPLTPAALLLVFDDDITVFGNWCKVKFSIVLYGL